ncbi:superoxide dismutase [Phakopsora pachyrhizi]|uniref:superoxide dismutase n=1 Tax=Phakopsora pachyrhizi TaxID=170000 RepID=A0AAV0B6L7_PHAPC|nr:superoxide dismutase [Phakopsora pachyrhizi]
MFNMLIALAITLVHAGSVFCQQAASAQQDSSTTIVANTNLNGAYGVSGQISFTLIPTTEEVAVKISVKGLMAINSTAQFGYHIHTNPISSDGNCSSALGHLDPLQVTDSVVCNGTARLCQIGDLSGRNGKLPGNQSVANVSYTDKFLRFWPQPFTLLGRSIVIHAPNTTRIACGNITSVVDGTADNQGKPTNQSSNYVTVYSTRAPPPSNNTANVAEPLPDVTETPNVILVKKQVTQMMNNSSETVEVNAAAPAATNFTYTPGAQLPSQEDFNILNGTNLNSTTSAKPQTGSSSGIEKIEYPLFFGFCAIMMISVVI